MNLASFLAHSVKLEYEAELMYRKLSGALDPVVNKDAVVFFQEMAGYAQRHLQEVMQRAGIADVSELPESGYVWGDDAAAESISLLPAANTAVDLDQAMELALGAECRAAAFYEQAASSSPEPKVRSLAAEFAAEERGHALQLERFIGRKPY